jgi:hypothetical protein
LRCLIDFDRFAVKFYHMHNLDGVVRILLTLELDKSVGLMLVGDLVSRNVNIDDRSTLRKEFPEYIFVNFLIDIARVDGGLLIAFIERRYSSHTLIINKLLILKMNIK